MTEPAQQLRNAGRANVVRALREFEQFYNGHRPHQGIANAQPLRPLPPPAGDQAQIARRTIQRCARLSGVLDEYRHAA
jgi:hypothetical protein